MANELIDIYDEQNNPLGIQKMKSEAHKTGLWHRTAHIWVYNSKGEVLLQLRAAKKDLHPNVWDMSVAGHIGAGEDPLLSGIREMEEEIGLKAKKENLKFWMIRKNTDHFGAFINNEFYYIYFFRYDGDINELPLQEDEVTKIKFMPIAELEQDLKDHPKKYVTHKEYWFEALNEIKKLKG